MTAEAVFSRGVEGRAEGPGVNRGDGELRPWASALTVSDRQEGGGHGEGHA